jgi:septum formation protein
MKERFILASSSPQRVRILKDLGLSFQAIPSNVDEHHDGLSKPHAIVKSIALRKAQAIGALHPKSWVIGCDTIVVLKNGKISLKPKGIEDARRTLKSYRNVYCDVYSGLALLRGSEKFIAYEKTRLYFGNFTDAQVEDYLKTGEWKGSSGAMTIEGKAGSWITRQKGEYWNVVGLPINTLKKLFKKAGLR